MDIDRFRECAQAYGASRRRWPAPSHALFDRFVTGDEGRAILADAERVDRFLDAWESERRDASTTLQHAILARASGEHAHQSKRLRRAWRWSAMAAIVVLGFAFGFAQAPREPAPDPIAQMIFGPTVQRGVGL